MMMFIIVLVIHDGVMYLGAKFVGGYFTFNVSIFFMVPLQVFFDVFFLFGHSENSENRFLFVKL